MKTSMIPLPFKAKMYSKNILEKFVQENQVLYLYVSDGNRHN